MWLVSHSRIAGSVFGKLNKLAIVMTVTDATRLNDVYLGSIVYGNVWS